MFVCDAEEGSRPINWGNKRVVMRLSPRIIARGAEPVTLCLWTSQPKLCIRRGLTGEWSQGAYRLIGYLRQ